MRGWHMINMHAAVNQLEESREILMEKVSEYEGRPLGVIQELNASFGNGRRDFVDEKRKSNSSFLHGCMEFLCNQGRWQRVIGAAAKVIAVSMSVSCTLQFCGTKLQSCTSRGSTMRSVPNNFQIDVLKGRG
ncbi:plastid division protein PDV1 [Senna tora]|uniref:Plastid division protein PDV1 n=1 Tax=Senna tora TaxID=362788 RepID=A0A834WK24_9FABA|nr:plastid division protein PDV1 [Senna tora]